MNDGKPVGYMVYCFERLRDGTEEFSKAFDNQDGNGLQRALDYMAMMGSGFGHETMELKLFELGRQLPVKREEDEVVETTRVVKNYKFSVKE